MTYLEMCKKLRRECGIQGSGPTTVTGQTGLLQKLVDWIADANDEICAMWFDWDFLWSEFSESTIVSTPTITAPSDLGVWDRSSFYLDYATADYRHLCEQPYKTYRDFLAKGTRINDKPSFFSVKPDGDIVLDPPPDAIYSLTSEYWKTASSLSANTDESLIPARFQRIVIARAKMFFAEHENAPEVMQGAQLEYNALLPNLEASQLPGHHARRMSDNDLVVVPE